MALGLMEGLRLRGAELYAALRGSGPLLPLVEALGVKREAVPTWRVRDPRGYIALARVAARIRPDLIYDHSAEFIPVTVGELLGIPVVIHRHSVPVLVGGRLRRRLQRILLRWSYTRASAVIAVSEAVYRAIVELGVPAGRVTLVKNGLPIDRFVASSSQARAAIRAELGLESDAVVISLIARLCELKAQRLLLEAARRLPCDELKLHFLFVGRDEEQGGAYEAYLKRLALEFGLVGCVTFAGHRDDIPDVLAASDMTVLPSKAEAFGLAIVESMAARRPIIATATTGACELLEDGVTGLIVPIDDAAALASAILRLVKDPNLQATLAANAYTEVAANYNEDVFVENIIGVLSGAAPPHTQLDMDAMPQKR